MAGYQEGSGEIEFLQGGAEDIEAVSLARMLFTAHVMRRYPYLWVDRMEGCARRVGMPFTLVLVLARSFPLHLRWPIVIPMVTGVDTMQRVLRVAFTTVRSPVPNPRHALTVVLSPSFHSLAYY